MAAAVVGAEGHSVLGPHDRWVVELEPGHAEDDRVVAKSRGIEAKGLSVRANFELDRYRIVREKTRSNGTAIDDFEFAGHGFGLERDMVALGEPSINERGRSAGVEHGNGRDSLVMNNKVNRKDNMFLRVETGCGKRHKRDIR